MIGGMKDPARVKAAQLRYQAKNKEKILARTRAWHAANPERSKAYMAKYRADGRYKQRMRERNRRSLYGEITRPEPLACENPGCRVLFSNTRKGSCVDHDHATKKFRGWLCQSCNFALGHARDDGQILRGLATYLARVDA
jgi:hypothetical protein